MEKLNSLSQKAQIAKSSRQTQVLGLIFSVFLFNLLSSATVLAAPEKLNVKPHKIGEYVTQGIIIGGNSGTAFSLLKVQNREMGEGVERITLEYGDIQGLPIAHEPGYFHVAIDQSGQRIVIDLSQMAKTAVDVQGLHKALAGSRIVTATDMVMDPEDNSTNIILRTKGPVEVRVSLESRLDKMNQVAIDLRPVKKGHR